VKQYVRDANTLLPFPSAARSVVFALAANSADAFSELQWMAWDFKL
jgi:hypothetical protein